MTRRLARRAFLVPVLVGLCVSTGPVTVTAPTDIEAGEDAVILDDTLTIDITSSTEARVTRSWRIKILTEAGLDKIERLEQSVIYYWPCCPVRNLRGAVIAPSGKRTAVRKQDVYDGAAVAEYELYSDSRYRDVDFPGVVPGSVLEFGSEQEFTNLFYLPDVWTFQEVIPIRARTLVLRTPPPLEVRTRVHGSPESSRREEKGVVIQEWRARDVPALKRERTMPPLLDLVPRVELFPREVLWDAHRIDGASWNGIAQWEWALVRDKIEPDPEVAAKAKELTAGLTDPMEMTRRIYEFVQKDISYVAIEIGIGGWEPHHNGAVFRNRYGDCKDKATLAIAMLKAVGLRGYPVPILMRDRGIKDADFPSPRANHQILAVPSKDGYLFLDPTSERTAFGDLPSEDQGANVLVVKEDGTGEIVTTPVYPPERNRTRTSVTAAVSAAGDITGTLWIEAYGQSRRGFDEFVAANKPSETAHALERYVATLSPGAVMEAHEVALPARPEDPLRITIRFSTPHAITRAGSVEVLSPHLVRFTDFARVIAYPARRHPVFFDYLRNEEAEVRLALPPGRTVRKVPADTAVEGAGVTVATSYALTTENGRHYLGVKRSVKVGRREVPVDEYPALRKALSAVAEEEARAVTLQPEG